jgi:hypothetical protein
MWWISFSVETSAVSQDPLSCHPARLIQALPGYAALPIQFRTCVRYAGSVGTWHDLDLGRPIAAPLERCAQLLGVDLATIQEVAAKVEPYLRADGTKIWSLTQLEHQLRPAVRRVLPELPRP